MSEAFGEQQSGWQPLCSEIGQRKLAQVSCHGQKDIYCQLSSVPLTLTFTQSFDFYPF